MGTDGVLWANRTTLMNHGLTRQPLMKENRWVVGECTGERERERERMSGPQQQVA